FRKDKKSFDGTNEIENPPPRLTGLGVIEELNGYDIKFGKEVKDNPDLPFNWKKKSIFFELEYWKDNLLRHNLDVMHIEKNVCESIVGTLMNLDGKTKDHIKARLDLQEMEENASEAKIGGPVHYRWMYPIERYLSTLKSYVRNKSRPEGSIAEGYIVEECLSSCSLYLSPDVETEHNTTSRNYDDGGSVDIEKLHMTGYQRITEELRALASGPAEVVKNYKGFIINGFIFQIKELGSKRKTQNSRVMLEAMTNSFSSSRDNNLIVGDVTYYGVINDIIELEYSADKKVVLFDCDWISNGRRKKEEDENGFTLLNFKGLKSHNEPFILASQAQQVFYVPDPLDKGWKVVIKTTARDSFDMTEQTCDDDVETYLQSNTSSGPPHDESMDISLIREGVSGTNVDENTLVIDGDENQF
ncbi:uncharacterized protein Tco_1372360, partial [Tanacetum coccineum]